MVAQVQRTGTMMSADMKEGTNTKTKTRTYTDAIHHLNTLQSNAAAIEAASKSPRSAMYSMHDMREFLARVGYQPEDLNKLNVLHVAGTKGKGSTCAFIDSVLRRTRPGWTVGLYTSPHLVAVRERIRINGSPISEESFAKYFFEVWDRLEANDKRLYDHTPSKPLYFRMVTLVAFHIFSSLKVNAVVLEVGVGGRYDCTNVVPKPVVTGISALGIDHVTMLGRTLREIAGHKAGIYKEGVPALTVEQPTEAMEVVEKEAREIKASTFKIIKPNPEIAGLTLGSAGDHQYQNANLAVGMVEEFFERLQVGVDVDNNTDTDTTNVNATQADSNLIQPLTNGTLPPLSSLPKPFREGLELAKWPGRCQTVVNPLSPKTTWFLDGAHTVDSLRLCVKWFMSPRCALRGHEGRNPKRILIFSCTGNRNATAFVDTVLSGVEEEIKNSGRDLDVTTFFDKVVFCSTVTYADGTFKGDLSSVSLSTSTDAMKPQRELGAAWKKAVPGFRDEDVLILGSIQDAVRVVRGLESGDGSGLKENGVNGKEDGKQVVDVLVTGSLHLVGGVIEVAGLSDLAL